MRSVISQLDLRSPHQGSARAPAQLQVHSRVPCRHGALVSVLGSAPEGRTAVVGTPARAERVTQSATKSRHGATRIWWTHLQWGAHACLVVHSSSCAHHTSHRIHICGLTNSRSAQHPAVRSRCRGSMCTSASTVARNPFQNGKPLSRHLSLGRMMGWYRYTVLWTARGLCALNTASVHMAFEAPPGVG